MSTKKIVCNLFFSLSIFFVVPYRVKLSLPIYGFVANSPHKIVDCSQMTNNNTHIVILSNYKFFIFYYFTIGNTQYVQVTQ